MDEKGLRQVSDTGELEKFADQVIAANPKQVEQFRGGKERETLCAVFGRCRLPKMPAIGETLPGYDVTGWYALFVPAKTPKEIIQKMYAGAKAAGIKVLEPEELVDELDDDAVCPFIAGSVSTISMMAGWNRFKVPRGDSVSNARVTTLLAAR